MPQVHFGMDPEFSMKDGSHPGKKIGTYDADDVNYVSGYLADVVKKYNLPPKILIVHRFTKKMVTNYQNIKLRQEVQIVMDMDGLGDPGLKTGFLPLSIFITTRYSLPALNCFTKTTQKSAAPHAYARRSA